MGYALSSKKKKFKEIVKAIKEVRIQGASNIAKASLDAYFLMPNEKSAKILIDLRSTEPMLWKVLENARKMPKEKIISHFSSAQEKINRNVIKIIKDGDVIFTHCHSTNVVNSLINARKKGKHFEVYNTETRPLFQGRKTAHELDEAGIKVVMSVDSAIGSILTEKSKMKKVNKIFLGADAITKKGFINKVGSKAICMIAKEEKIPVYIIADSWKFTKKIIPIEQRKLNEVWSNAPQKIKIKNPAFEFVQKKYIYNIISELGILNYRQFLKSVNP